MVLEGLKRMFQGPPAPPSNPLEGIPESARKAHHELVNTAMAVKRSAQEVDQKATELLEVLYRDIKGKNGTSE